MAKIIQFSNEFDGLYLKENSPCIGGRSCLTSSGTFFPRDFGQEHVLQSVRGGSVDMGQGWPACWGFPDKASRSYFLE